MFLRRSHAQIFSAFLCVHLVLSVTAGYMLWLLMDGKLRSQASDSAHAVARLLTEGGFTANQDVLTRMQELTGYKFTLMQESDTPSADLISVPIGDGSGRTVFIDYRSQGYQEHLSVIYWSTLALLFGGLLIFIPVAWLLARRFARPLEILSSSAAQIGLGHWNQPIETSGSEEVQHLSRSLEKMRQQLIELDSDNRQAERLATLGTFTATIAHEVRNPLAAVKIIMQLLAKDYPDARFGHIQDELERLDLMVDELLGYSAGMQVHLQACLLEPLVRDVLRLLQRQADHADVQIDVRGASSVMADERRLRQLLLNLLLNAIQAQHGGGKVLIDIQADGFVVIDEGPGVPPELINDLFTAFSSRREHGTGLGLHLAKHIAEAHDALLHYERDERGTCFILSGLKACE